MLGMFPTSPLFAAISFGDSRMVRALLDLGANTKETDPDGLTALDMAVLGHRADIIPMLVKAGAPLNAADKHGYTALHYAAAVDFGDAACLEAMMRAGADSTVRNGAGRTAKEQATFFHHAKLAALLP